MEPLRSLKAKKQLKGLSEIFFSFKCGFYEKLAHVDLYLRVIYRNYDGDNKKQNMYIQL